MWGPFTRIDPANSDNKSCLDLVIMSKNLLNYLKELKIDKDRLFPPCRPTKKAIYTDHLSILVIFKNIPLREQTEKVNKEIIMWNTNKTSQMTQGTRSPNQRLSS